MRHAERLLSEEIGNRIRALELGQVEDALIDRRERQVDRLARAALDFDFDKLVLSRTHGVGCRDGQVEGPRGHVDRGIAHANRAARLGVEHRVARAVDVHHQIRTLAPLCGNRERHTRALGGNRPRFNRQDAVGRHDDLRIPVIRRDDCKLGSATRHDLLAGQGDLHTVGRFDALIGHAPAPADIEPVAGHGAVRTCHSQFVAPPVEAVNHDRCGCAVLRRGNALIGDGDRSRPAPAPAVALAVPVIMIVDLDQFPFQFGGLRLAVCADGCKLEARRLALRHAVLRARADTEVKVTWPVGNPHAFRHRAPAWLKHADNGVQAQWPARFHATTSRLDAHHGLAGAIGRAHGHLHDLLAELFIMGTEAETVKALERAGVGLDPCPRFHGQTGAGRTVEKPCIDRDLARLPGAHRNILLRRKLDTDTLGHEILDRETHRTGAAHAIDIDHGAPFAARSIPRQVVIKQACASLRAGKAQLAGLKPVGAVDGQAARAVIDHHPGPVAHHCRDMDRFARPVDPAIGVEIGIDGTGCRAPASVELGQVDRGARQVEHGQVAARTKGHDQLWRRVPGARQDRAGKGHTALGIGLTLREQLVVAGHQLDICINDFLAVPQRP